MILEVVAVYDTKARSFLMPFYTSHKDVALRAIREAVATPGHQIARTPSDFLLYHLGTFNDEGAQFIINPVPALMCNAGQFLKDEAYARVLEHTPSKANGADNVQSKIA